MIDWGNSESEYTLVRRYMNAHEFHALGDALFADGRSLFLAMQFERRTPGEPARAVLSLCSLLAAEWALPTVDLTVRGSLPATAHHLVTSIRELAAEAVMGRGMPWEKFKEIIDAWKLHGCIPVVTK